MCKDKWNCLNGDYKISSYHKSIGHNTSYSDMNIKEWNSLHFSRQFNEECYNAIETIQDERNINVPLHV